MHGPYWRASDSLSQPPLALARGHSQYQLVSRRTVSRRRTYFFVKGNAAGRSVVTAFDRNSYSLRRKNTVKSRACVCVQSVRAPCINLYTRLRIHPLTVTESLSDLTGSYFSQIVFLEQTLSLSHSYLARTLHVEVRLLGGSFDLVLVEARSPGGCQGGPVERTC